MNKFFGGAFSHKGKEITVAVEADGDEHIVSIYQDRKLHPISYRIDTSKFEASADLNGEIMTLVECHVANPAWQKMFG